MTVKITRNILLFLFILSLMLNVLNPAIIYYSFLIQRDYIIKNLCVERFKENNTCQGCCQLEKKMKAASQDKNSEFPYPENKVEKITIYPFDLNQDDHYEKIAGPTTIQHCDLSYQFLFYNRIFHPPELLS